MRCPQCGVPSLRGQSARQEVLVEVCSQCRGLWLDRGQLDEFAADPRALEKEIERSSVGRRATDHLCPRCDGRLEQGPLPGGDASGEQCPSCGGLWLRAEEVDRAASAAAGNLDLRPLREAAADTGARERAEERVSRLAAGLLALPNLFLRSLTVLGLLYGLLAVVLIALAQLHVLGAGAAVTIGVVIILLQFLLGPWFMDLMLRWLYHFRWVR